MAYDRDESAERDAQKAQDAAMKAFDAVLVELGYVKKEGSYTYENGNGMIIMSWCGPDVTVRTARTARSRARK